MEGAPTPTTPRRSNRIRKNKEEKEVLSDDNATTTVAPTAGSAAWSESELQIFLDGLKEFGTAFKKIASTLRNRTPQMVEELYQSNYHYLTLTDDASPAQVLFSILSDRHSQELEAMEMEGEEEVAAVVLAEGQKESALAKSGSPRRSLSPKRKLKGKTSSVPNSAVKKPPVGSTPAAVVMTPERNKRGKTTRQLFPPSPVSGRRKASSTPKQTPTKKQKTSQNQSRSTTPPKSTRVLRTRKSAAGADPMNGGSTPPPSNSDGLPLKLREKFLKGKMGESPSPSSATSAKKKGTSQAKSKKDPSRVTDMQNQLQNFLNGKRSLNWCMYEWFYADIDRPFFDINDFQNCLDSTGVGNVTKLTRVEWGFVRTVFGKARRFSPAFLKEEREKLQSYRESIRQMRHGKSPVNRAAYHFSYVPPSLPQSTRVLAFHPDTKQLQLGTILAEEHARYKVEFDNKDLMGGALWISDTDVMAHEAKDWSSARTPTNGSPRTPVRYIPVSPLAGLSNIQQTEVYQLFELVKLLRQKEDLIQRLRKMNEDAEKMAIRADFPTEFQRHYALAIKKLAEVNDQIKPRLLNIRNHTPQASPGGLGRDQGSSSNGSNSNNNHVWPQSLFPSPGGGGGGTAGSSSSSTPNGLGGTTPVTPASSNGMGAFIPSPGTTSASNSPPSPTFFAPPAVSPPAIVFTSPPSSISNTPTTTTTTTTTTTNSATTTTTPTPRGEETEVAASSPMEVSEESTKTTEEKQEDEDEEDDEEVDGKPVTTPSTSDEIASSNPQ